MIIRSESPADIEKIRHLHLEAFETDTEANLVDALRSADIELISIVAEENETIIGHILFSPVDLDGDIKIMGLAPVAVLPDQQNQGIGSKLVNDGLTACKKTGYQAFVVLGHSDYYPRFGFESSVHFGIASQYDVPEENFMVNELEKDVLRNVSGTAKYHDVFNEI